MSDLRRGLARFLLGTAVAIGAAAALLWAGAPDAFAAGAGVGVGVVVGRVLFGRGLAARVARE